MPVPAIVTIIGIPIATAIGTRIARAIAGNGGGTGSPQQMLEQQQGLTLGRTFEPGADIKIESQGLPPGSRFEIDPTTGEISILKRRRRRKRLLTCSDKADIAFLTGTLGKGALAQGAITSVLSKCG